MIRTICLIISHECDELHVNIHRPYCKHFAVVCLFLVTLECSFILPSSFLFSYLPCPDWPASATSEQYIYLIDLRDMGSSNYIHLAIDVVNMCHLCRIPFHK